MELEDQIFEAKKMLEQYSADYQEVMSDESARQDIFEIAKQEELVRIYFCFASFLVFVFVCFVFCFCLSPSTD